MATASQPETREWKTEPVPKKCPEDRVHGKVEEKIDNLLEEGGITGQRRLERSGNISIYYWEKAPKTEQSCLSSIGIGISVSGQP